jgi:RNA polymerase sigma factor (sigma-70 family)
MTRAPRFEDLFNRYYRAIVSYLVRDVGLSREDARDLAQDTFTRVYESMDRYRGEAEWAFLKTTAHNLAANHFRRQGAAIRKGIDTPLETVRDLRSAHPPIDVVLIQRETSAAFHKRLADALAELPELTRQCVLLRLRPYSYQQIKDSLNLTMDAVKTRLKDAKKRLLARVGELPDGVEWPDELGEDGE